MGPLRRLPPRRQARRRRGVGGRVRLVGPGRADRRRDAGAVGHRARVQSRSPGFWLPVPSMDTSSCGRHRQDVSSAACPGTSCRSRILRSPDGAGDDLIERTVRLWDVGTGRRRLRSRAESRERSERRASCFRTLKGRIPRGRGKARVQSRRKAVGVHCGRRNDSRDWISTI